MPPRGQELFKLTYIPTYLLTKFETNNTETPTFHKFVIMSRESGIEIFPYLFCALDM